MFEGISSSLYVWTRTSELFVFAVFVCLVVLSSLFSKFVSKISREKSCPKFWKDFSFISLVVSDSFVEFNAFKLDVSFTVGNLSSKLNSFVVSELFVEFKLAISFEELFGKVWVLLVIKGKSSIS